MHFMFLRVNLISSCLFSISLASPHQSKSQNANHIFNAIHSSMRQWGSSLNHNGMSLFLATVPAGTQLYHGTSKQDPIEGLQWLAFEPEHALIFAGARRMPPPDDGRGPPEPPEWHAEDDEPQELHYKNPPPMGHEPHHKLPFPPPPPPHHDGRPWPKLPKGPFDPHPPGPLPPPHHPHGKPPGPLPPPPPGPHPPPPHHPHGEPPGPPPPPPKHGMPPLPGHLKRPPHFERRRDSQQLLGLHSSEEPIRTGYLHTYVSKHTLRLLYIDGLSAGKTNNGTLDTQDRLLLNQTDDGGPMVGEFKRAREMCNLSSTLWEDKIDGVIRMEGGFEIILCDFKKHLDRVDVIAASGHNGGPGGLLGGWQYLKAVTARYDGIGGERVKIDYEDFVSVFAYPGIEGLFNNDVVSDYAMPRLQKVKDSDLLRMRADVTAMIFRKDWDEEKDSKNWQAVADQVVQRYSTPLHQLHTSSQLRGDKDMIAEHLATLLRPFIDYTARNATLETSRCIAQFIPPLPSPPRPATSLAHRTLYSVTQHICDTLLTALSIASSPTSHASFTSIYASHAVEIIDELVEYLRWTTWKQCGTCADDEICFIPIWPMGSYEDHANPQCLNEEVATRRMGYWGPQPGPPRHGYGKMPPKEE